MSFNELNEHKDLINFIKSFSLINTSIGILNDLDILNDFMLSNDDLNGLQERQWTGIRV